MEKNFLTLVNKLEFANIGVLKTLYGCQVLKLNGAWLLFNDVLPEIFCNLGVVIRATAPNGSNLITEAERHFKKKKMKPAFQITPATTPQNFPKLLISRGFKKVYAESWMVHRKEIIPPKSAGGRVIKVKTVSAMKKFIDLFNNFENNLPQSEGMNEAYESVFWDSFKKRHGKTKVNHYLAILDQKPVGFGSLVIVGNHASIYNLGVLAPLRGKGMGSVLVNELIADAKKAKVKEVFLQTSRNSPAQKFFKQMGFKQVFTTNVFEKI